MTTYAKMDHAGWVERNNRIKVSELGKRVAYILGVVFGGIYNAPVKHSEVDYTQENGISVRLRHSRDMATYDDSSLTRLVLICHELCIRVALRPTMIGFKYVGNDAEHQVQIEPDEDGRMPGAHVVRPVLELCFWQREPGGTEWHNKHPTIDEAVGTFRKWFDGHARELATGEGGREFAQV